MERFKTLEIEDPKLPSELLWGSNLEESILIKHHKTKFGKPITELTIQGFRYTAIHMEIVGKSILLKYGDHNDGLPRTPIIFVAATFDQTQQADYPNNNLQVFGRNFSDFRTSPETHFLSVASLDDQNWVVLCFLKKDSKIQLLYFDPLGKQFSAELKSSISKYCNIEETITHLDSYNTDLTNVEEIDTGPICLKYLEFVISGLQKSNNFMSTMLSKSKFHVLAELNLLPHERLKELTIVKNHFQKQCYLHVSVSTCAHRIHETPFHEFYHFKLGLNEYLEKCLPLQKAKQHVLSYLTCLKESLEYQEKSTQNLEDNVPVLEDAKSSLNTNPFLQKLIQEGESAINDMRANPLKPISFGYEDWLALEAKKMKHGYCMSEGFSAISECLNEKNICTDKVKTELHNILGLKEEIVEKLFECGALKEDRNLEYKEIQDLHNFLHSLKLPSSRSQLCAQLVQSTKELQTEEIPDGFQVPSDGFDSGLLNDETIKNLHNDFKRYYTENWKEVTKESIRSWAEATKLNSLQQQNNPETAEIIAVLDRSYEILSGERLRITEILALLLFTASKNEKGNIHEIPPGEGRATIVAAMLAIMKILSGERYVDIITLNPELAEDALQDHSELFYLYGIQVATNNTTVEEFLDISGAYERDIKLRKCYLADVVYGTMGTFKKDYLLDLSGARRGNREFGTLILEEVGSLMIEDAFSLATLSSDRGLPGKEILQGVYNQIWSSLHSAEAACTSEVAEQICKEKSKLRVVEGISPENAHKDCSNLLLAIEMTVYDKMHMKVKQQINSYGMNAVPNYLIDFVESRLDKWIDSAMIAKYKLKENHDYYLELREGSQVAVVPFAQEGSMFRNSWSGEILQFLQLKHDIQPTPEKMAICSISNYGYISLFKSNIIGLTCTLGSATEQELIKNLYNVEIASIFTFKENKFQELEGKIIHDKNWAKFIAVEANMVAVQDGRAVLIICKTVEDCQRVEFCLKFIDTIRPVNPDKVFEEYSHKFRTIRTFTEDQDAAISPNVLYSGDVVVAIRAVARTLLLIPSEAVDSNGGLSVCLGFLPKTQREKEMFFRHARLGSMGTAEMIVRASEVQKISPSKEMKDTAEVEHENSEIENYSENIPTENDLNTLPYFHWEGVKIPDCLLHSKSKETRFLNFNENEMSPDELEGYNGDDEGLDPGQDMERIILKSTDANSHSESEVNEVSKNISDSEVEFSSLDEHVLSLYMEYWYPHTYEYFGVDVENATVEELKKCIWKNSVSKMTEGEKIDLAKFMESGHVSCYRSHLDNFDKEVEATVKKHNEIFEERFANNFSHTISDIEKITQFWLVPNKQFHSDSDEITTRLRLNDLVCMQFLENGVHKLYVQDNLFHQFWNFCRSHLFQHGNTGNALVNFPSGHLENVWAVWTYTQDWNHIYKTLNADALEHKNQWEICKKISEDVFNEFKQFLAKLSEESSDTNELERTADDIPGAMLLPHQPTSGISDICPETRTIITTGHNGISLTDSLPSIETYSSNFSRQNTKQEEDIQRVMLTELEQIGLDVLQHLRTQPEIEASTEGQNEIAAGLSILSKSKSTFIPPGLSDGFPVDVTLITEGIMKIALDLLGNTEEMENYAELIHKKKLIVYTFSVLTSPTFVLNRENSRILDHASNGCLLYAKMLRASPRNSNFHLFLQRMGIHLKRALTATKYSLMKSYPEKTTDERIHLPIFSQICANLAEDCRQIFGANIANSVDAYILEAAINGCKPTIKNLIQSDIERLVDRGFDEITFFDGCLDSFDEFFQNACQAICKDVVQAVSKFFCGKSQFEYKGIYETPAWRSILEISNIFATKLQKYLSHSLEEGAGQPEVLREYALELLTEKIHDALQISMNDFKTMSKVIQPTEKQFSASCMNTKIQEKHAFNFCLLKTVAEKRNYIGKVLRQDCLLKYQLAYMMDTARLVREVEYLKHLKSGGSIATLEDVKILSNYLRYSIKIHTQKTNEATQVGAAIFGEIKLEIKKKHGYPRGYYSFICQPDECISGVEDLNENERFLQFLSEKTGKDSRRSKEFWNYLEVFLESKIETNAEWHKQIQTKFSNVLGGNLQFPEVDPEMEEFGWSDFEDLDIAYEVVVEESERKAGDMQELNSILQGNDKLQFGHSIAKHSSPQSGLKTIKGDQRLKHLSTFENYESQIQALKACLRKIKNKKKIFKPIRGMDFEIHVDASQLDLPTPLRMYELQRKDRGKPEQLENCFGVNFITLVLGYRHKASTLGMKKFFHVQTIVPRAKRPGDLIEGRPYHIKIRSRAGDGSVVAGMKKWNDVNERFFKWMKK